ncbi:MAG: hypothetical protein SGJ09_18255 [Phycisphaerae bacterium]|nr:hypothetical protein [Phycisphaerae bacterium]
MRCIAPLFVSCVIASAAHAVGPLDFWFGLHEYVVDTWLTKLKPGNSVPWRTNSGEVLMHEWRGEHVSLLTERNDYDPTLVQTLLNAADAYWVRCREICGNSPPPDPDRGFATGGRPMLVELVRPRVDQPAPGELGNQFDESSTKAIGIVGVARTSVTTDELESLLRAIARGNSVAPLGMSLPTAIGRNFFFFDSELGSIAPTGDIASAYASLLAGHASELLGWFPPNDDRPLDANLDRYERDPKAVFDVVLGAATPPPEFDVASLWTALLVRVSYASGRHDFVERLWRATSECPTSATQEDAVTNLVVAASGASGSDLTQRFISWRFPVTDEAKSRVREALAAQRKNTAKLKR